MHSKCVRKFLLAPMDVTKLYHHYEGESCSFCEWRAQKPIDIGWERMFEDNLRDNNNAATCVETNEESVFIVDEELITVMDSIVEEHECKNKACNVITESSYSGIEPHERPCSSTEQVHDSSKSQKHIERSMECGIPEKTHNQTN